MSYNYNYKHMIVKPETHRQLKVLAAQLGASLDSTINTLLETFSSRPTHTNSTPQS